MKAFGKLFAYDRVFPKGQMRIPAAEIIQIAELSLMKGSEIPGHVQACDEITYAVSGSAMVHSGDHVYEMSAGQVHYIQKGQYHKIVVSQNDNFRYCCVGFHPNEDYREIGVFLEAVRHRKDFVIGDEGNIRTLFPLLIDEFHIRDAESDSMIHFYFCQMLIQLYRMLCGKSREKLSKINTSSSNVAVYRALKYIDQEYVKIRQVKQIAQALSYSEYYLCHIFKEKMDMTVKEYLMQKKIMAAAELLVNSSMTVTEISDFLEFSSLHSFSLAFKRHMGVSPSGYRSQMPSQRT